VIAADGLDAGDALGSAEPGGGLELVGGLGGVGVQAAIASAKPTTRKLQRAT
jgi:hypothetical protein